MNDRIRAREVLVIGEAGEQLGVMSVPNALQIAREQDLDLVEVSPTALPPVCRLLDYGKYRYEQAKKERETRKHQKIVLVKEIRVTPMTTEHDVQVKSRLASGFLQDGDKVRIVVRFRGRAITHPQLGQRILESFIEHLRSVGAVEQAPTMEGRAMSMLIAPSAKK